MLEQILGCFPDTIEHSQYKNHSIPLRQVVWIKVDCPDDSSVRALCHKILSEWIAALSRLSEPELSLFC
nr:hypothetical protein [Klebsiella pneumoniae subsp. pneumoniae]